MQGLYDRLRLPHRKERVQAAPDADLTMLYEGLRDNGANGGLSSVYGHR
jgi:hypothetical protein